MNPERYTQFLKCQRKLFRFSLSLTKNLNDAEDLCQETLEKLWNLKEEWPLWKNFDAYAMSMIRNASLNFIKKNKGRVHVGIDEIIEQSEPNETEKNIVLNDLQIRFNFLIRKLPDIQRNILYLREIEEMEYKEISEVLQITEAQVKVYLFRARQYLKTKVNGQR